MSSYEHTKSADIEMYWKSGGTYVMPVEVVNRMISELEEMDDLIDEANNNAAWWKNRYEAQVQINEELKHDRNNEKISKRNRYSKRDR